MIYIELKIEYSIKFKDGKDLKDYFLVHLPEVLAQELIAGKVRKQIEFFISNLALLQGAEEGKFICATPEQKFNTEFHCICSFDKDCSMCSIPAAFYDSHVCSDETGYGVCSTCGAIIHGSSADYELHSYDPPGTA